MEKDIERSLNEFIKLLEKEEFFNAHERLEECWRRLKRENIKLQRVFRGLINGAIALEHKKRSSYSPSIKTYNGFLKRKEFSTFTPKIDSLIYKSFLIIEEFWNRN